MSSKESPSTTAKEFAKEHWPSILASTLAGATILLLIRYYRKKKSERGENIDETQFAAYEGEAETVTEETPVLLETGLAVLADIPGATQLAKQLAEGLEGKAKETMYTLSQLKR
jgi:hypothetical protein